jgi:surface polysaccharide O-acyltransferase-like enzyme
MGAEVTENPHSKRQPYIDNIRSLVILLVVAMHSSVCYSGIGGWYYKEGVMENLGIVEMAVFGFLQSYTQAWFMGILFFISAYFAAAAIAKKNSAAFVRERLFRLGIPLLFYMFVIAPFIYFVVMSNGGLTAKALGASYLRYLLHFGWLGSTGPLWFNEALLIFCLVFALFRRKAANLQAPEFSAGCLPSKGKILLVILGTGIAAFLIRLVFPIGTDVSNLQFSFFASYIVLFVLGIKAGENRWLDQLTSTKAAPGKFWFTAALALGMPLWAIIMIAGGALSGTLLIYGGLYWQSAVYALWESFTAIAFSLGLVWFFKKHCNVENALTRFVAANVFGVYMLHPPVLIGISLLFRSWEAGATLKFLVVTPLAIAASLGVSVIVRRIPAARVLLK